MLLRQGSRSADVRTVQQRLSDLGYSLSVDGIFGTRYARRGCWLSGTKGIVGRRRRWAVNMGGAVGLVDSQWVKVELFAFEPISGWDFRKVKEVCMRHNAEAIADEELDILTLESAFFCRDRATVIAFLEKNVFLIDLLTEAAGKVREYFGPRVELALEVFREPDDSCADELVARVSNLVLDRGIAPMSFRSL